MEFPELETNRLKLVQVNEEHTGSFFEIMSNDEVTKYYGMDALKDIEEASKIVTFFQRSHESNRGIRWGIIVKETGTFIGTVGLNNLSIPTKKAELGFELHPSHWNKGLMTEAAKEVLRYSFKDLALFRIGAVTFPQNEPSIQLLKRLGFVQEGLLRGYLYQNDSTHDALIFSLMSTEWALN
ncbi:GNAT family N-acetyltransferase [Alkalicoccobacillus porphyridii]|uniref:GNAT family N-acetyltransferase n=1 Tax=Alkalicoccobacillus porphyridii TaxID=2597270 RepID=A0A554A282_9BACI|nr:GNAT family N-acetyltransferase [Alkalicoccobacillus porphyridii]TSB47797.1 GNAT family N-acetyltransferase [Alkalicoccobacillus porphyridii]